MLQISKSTQGQCLLILAPEKVQSNSKGRRPIMVQSMKERHITKQSKQSLINQLVAAWAAAVQAKKARRKSSCNK